MPSDVKSVQPTLTITLPVSDGYIRQEIARMNAEMKPHQDAISGYTALIAALQHVCPHKTRSRHYNSEKCTDCGLAW